MTERLGSSSEFYARPRTVRRRAAAAFHRFIADGTAVHRNDKTQLSPA